MVRFLVDRIFDETHHYIECAGLHDDSKPTGGFVTGSKFTETDTGDVYMYSEGDTPSWDKVQAGPPSA